MRYISVNSIIYFFLIETQNSLFLPCLCIHIDMCEHIEESPWSLILIIRSTRVTPSFVGPRQSWNTVYKLPRRGTELTELRNACVTFNNALYCTNLRIIKYWIIKHKTEVMYLSFTFKYNYETDIVSTSVVPWSATICALFSNIFWGMLTLDYSSPVISVT